MPRLIAVDGPEPIALQELVEALNTEDFDPSDEECFAAMGPLLGRLGRNRSFLAELAAEELKDRCRAQSLRNGYAPQVIMLYRASAKYFIRANFWPSEKDSVFRTSGASPFFYHQPHDHNFSFLTVGYMGPGYWSEYYEYDYESVVGVPGEKVNLRFVEKSRLELGKVMLYRAHVDVHNQLPADDMSVSLNIMEAMPRHPWLTQYRFDVERGEIAGIMSHTACEALLAVAAHSEVGNARDVVESFAVRHPCDRIRASAIHALAGAEPELDGRVARLEAGARDPDRFVAGMSLRELRRIEAVRPWIEDAAAA
jgi:hypothetical protein